MPYTLSPEPGEQIQMDIRFQPSRKSEPFHFAVTDRALYIPATKFVVSGDPHHFRCVLIDEVREVAIQNIRPYGAWFFACLMALLGATLLFASILYSGPAPSPRGIGWGLALIAGGVLLPFASRGRQRLVVVLRKDTFKWNPPLVVDQASKNQVAEILQSIVAACQARGIEVKREGASPTAHPA